MTFRMKTWLRFAFFWLLVVFVKCDSVIGSQQGITPSEFYRKFQPSDLEEDINFLFQTLEAVHPNLYAYTPESLITWEREKLDNEITLSLTRIDFFCKIAPLVANLNDAHTCIYPPEEEFGHYLGEGGLLFPFELTFRGGKAFIAANYSADSGITVGSELCSINGVPITDIEDSLLLYVSGETTRYKTANLEYYFQDMLWYVYRFEPPFYVEFILGSTSNHHKRKITGVTRQNIGTERGIITKTGKQIPYTYTSLPGEKIGLIEVYSFFADPELFHSFLERSLTQIHKDSIKILIVDIRKNGGGNTMIGDELLRRIANKPFAQTSKEKIRVSKQIKEYFQNQQSLWRKRFPLYGSTIETLFKAISSAPEDSVLVFNTELEKPVEKPPRFDGEFYVLIGPYTFSSAVSFISAVKDYELGTLIGEETGGLATSYGEEYSFRLPNTQLKVGVSYRHFVRPSGVDNGRGVLPDYEIKQSIEDLKKGVDTILDFTKKLIKSKR